jgi:tRNA nucleotidyltransferase (CCA-adding enzyme)
VKDQTYLVGGAVRDELLGLEVKEQDWVITGTTPEALLKKGFRQVGSSFPVFLDPEKGEEYALARTERKKGHGYHGFSVEFDPGVSIEDDLLRRDLTINAIAKDQHGALIDPYGGQKDIEARVLRHVSPAFAEDPLRVLRVARFAARFTGLGFTVHPDTMALMRRITEAGELEHLVPERSWSEVFRAMGTEKPSVFITTLRSCGALAILLPEVEALYGVPQDARWHPEVDTGKHIELSMDLAASKEFGAEVVFALLLHDLGKGLTPPQDLPSHHKHEHTGLPLVDEVCSRLRTPGSVHKLARQVCAGHIRCHRLLEMKPAKIMNLLENLDAFRSKDIKQFVQACEADYLGREGLQSRDYPQGSALIQALDAALAVQVKDLSGEMPAPGPELGEKLRQARIEAIRNITIQSVTQ